MTTTQNDQVAREPSRTTLWRWRTGRTQPRPAPPGWDAKWCRENVAAICEAADHGARQAEACARRRWNLFDLDHDELRAVAQMRICEISAHEDRECGAWRVTAARYACQSYIRQHVIGVQKHTAALLEVEQEKPRVENAAEIVAMLRISAPCPEWAGWRDHIDKTAQAVRRQLEEDHAAHSLAVA